MIYCTRCLYPASHPLYVTFDETGVCSGCRVHEEKDRLDWDERLQMLRRIASEYRARSRSIHDCIVPVSGARDSYFIVHVVKHVLGLRPLLVTYNKHYNTQVGIRNLAYLRSLLGCDFMSMTVSPDRVKRITRETLRLRGSMYWHCLAGQTVFPVQIAVKFKIPLIIWGAHQGIDQVGMFSHLDEVEMTRKYRKEHDLMGLEAQDLVQQSDLTDADVAQYVYPHDKELEAVGVRGIYLNNYVRWDTKAQHERMIDAYEYETAPQQRTFDAYNDVDCFHYSGLHDYIKFLKHGYGKATDHACREIRLRRLTREAGAALAARYAAVEPDDMAMFLEWIGMTDGDLRAAVDAHRDTAAWSRDERGTWVLRDSVQQHLDDPRVDGVRLGVIDSCDFNDRSARTTAPELDHYTLIGRGWVDGAPASVASQPSEAT